MAHLVKNTRTLEITKLNENTVFQNVWDAIKIVLRVKRVASNTWLEKEKSQVPVI